MTTETTAIKTTKMSGLTSGLKSRLMPESFGIEKENITKYFSLNSWQFLVVLGIAISGLAAFVNTYDAWSGINSKIQTCAQSDALQKELNTQFIIIMVISCLAIVLGIILFWLFRNQKNQRRLVTMGITTTGIFGIIYALSIKFQNATNKIKLGISWTSFIGFLILGFFISGGIKVFGGVSKTDSVDSTEWVTGNDE